MAEEDHVVSIESDTDKLEEQDEMLRLLNEQLQQRFGQAPSQATSAVTGTIPKQATTDIAEEQSQGTPADSSASFFRLFNTPTSRTAENNPSAAGDLPRVRLQSPTDLVLLHGRSLNRILAVEDEDKSLVKERRRQIKSCAVNSEWLIKTSDASHWCSYPSPSRKVMHKTLLSPSHVRMPLSNAGILYLPSPRSARISKKVKENVENQGRAKLKTYPDLGKERVEGRIARLAAKRRAAAMQSTLSRSTDEKEKSPKVKKTQRVKRQSKRKRMHERAEKSG